VESSVTPRCYIWGLIQGDKRQKRKVEQPSDNREARKTTVGVQTMLLNLSL